jgi:hypothetical protein
MSGLRVCFPRRRTKLIAPQTGHSNSLRLRLVLKRGVPCGQRPEEFWIQAALCVGRPTGVGIKRRSTINPYTCFAHIMSVNPVQAASR